MSSACAAPDFRERAELSRLLLERHLACGEAVQTGSFFKNGPREAYWVPPAPTDPGLRLPELGAERGPDGLRALAADPEAQMSDRRGDPPLSSDRR